MEYQKRKHPRHREYDYSSDGLYFITVCTRNRVQSLSSVVGCADPGAPCSVRLTRIGSIVAKYTESIPNAYPFVIIENYVIMPNHVHMILNLTHGAPGSARPTVSDIIRVWKRLIDHECGETVFQASFYDHIIRDEHDFQVKWNYVSDNPRRWEEDEYNSG